MITIAKLDDRRSTHYDAFLKQDERASFFCSNAYRQFLSKFLGQQDHYLVAIDEHENIQAALPAFLHRNPTHGNVLNSLPFYGSNGGVIEHRGDTLLRKRLVEEFDRLAKQNNCATATLITSPWEKDLQAYDAFAGGLRDERIGQITELPDHSDKLMGGFHHKTRNMIHKAEKSNVSVNFDHSVTAMQFLTDVHHENMKQIGGRAKPAAFFEAVQRLFAPSQYRIYLARINHEPVAALLLLYFNKTVEYFTPVVKAKSRSMQPLSMLIHEAMRDAVAEGYRFWNWGGTWRSQEGVYRFKSRWGTSDHPYYYYTRIYNSSILGMPHGQLLDEYPYFYVYPFPAQAA